MAVTLYFPGMSSAPTGNPVVFANLDELIVGDLIVVMVDGNEWRYSITDIYTVTPEDLSPLRQNVASEILTLITCDNYNFLQDSYLERTVVVAERITVKRDGSRNQDVQHL